MNPPLSYPFTFHTSALSSYFYSENSNWQTPTKSQWPVCRTQSGTKRTERDTHDAFRGVFTLMTLHYVFLNLKRGCLCFCLLLLIYPKKDLSQIAGSPNVQTVATD